MDLLGSDNIYYYGRKNHLLREVPMRIGVSLPSRLGDGAPGGGLSPRDLIDLAVLADRAPGWSHAWVADSVLSLPFYDSVVSLAACAAATSRIRLGVACLASLGLRHPLLVAQQWANLDALSGGRMILVACPGEPPGDTPSGRPRARELAVFGMTHREKTARMAEAVGFLRAVSSAHENNAPVRFDGEYFSIRDLVLRPGFVQRPLPIWLAANPPADAPRHVVERVLRRVATLGGGWLTFAVTPKLLAERLRLLRELAEEAGRPLPADFPVCVYLNVNTGENAEHALADAVTAWQGETARVITPELVREVASVGPVGSCAERFAELAEAGATDVMIGLLSADPKRLMHRITESLLPLITGD
jgi:alkanesulfonate monooxygenase SsuD/methylene tetrahydromethanopterin reductase-like flavin-dependent oxidoreductase (luciferase family)